MMRASFDRPLVSIVVPACNEEGLVAQFIRDVSSCCHELVLSYELIIVENGSSDATAGIVATLQQLDNRLKLVQLPRADYGEALLRGFAESAGRYVVVFNVDFWDKRFLSIANADMLGYDLVTGSKLLPGSRDQRNFVRRSVSYGFNRVLRALWGYRGTDTHGLKILRRDLVAPVIAQCRTRTGIVDTEVMIRCQWAGLTHLELPVNVREVRPTRFTTNRILGTPRDLFQLYAALRTRNVDMDNNVGSIEVEELTTEAIS